MAEPARMGGKPPAPSTPVNGASRSSFPDPEMEAQASPTNSMMKRAWSPATTKFALATAVMPRMLSAVTAAIETTMNSHAGPGP